MKALLAQLPLLKNVLTDYRVIITFVGFILVLIIAGGIANYTKKPRKQKKKKNIIVVSQPAPAQEGEEGTETEGSAEETE